MPSDTRLKIGTLVPASLITMLQQMPHNAMVRTQLHALLKWPVPASCETYEQIKNWIEGGQYAQLEGSIRPTGEVPEMPYIPEPEEIGAFTEDRLPPYHQIIDAAVSAQVRHRYTEVGTCRYSCEYSGHGQFTLSTQEMNNLVDDALQHDWSMDQIVENAVEILNAACAEDPPECEPAGENDYSHHENTDDENVRDDVRNVPALRHELGRWIEQNRPDDWEEIER